MQDMSNENSQASLLTFKRVGPEHSLTFMKTKPQIRLGLCPTPERKGKKKKKASAIDYRRNSPEALQNSELSPLHCAYTLPSTQWSWHLPVLLPKVVIQTY